MSNYYRLHSKGIRTFQNIYLLLNIVLLSWKINIFIVKCIEIILIKNIFKITVSYYNNGRIHPIMCVSVWMMFILGDTQFKSSLIYKKQHILWNFPTTFLLNLYLNHTIGILELFLRGWKLISTKYMSIFKLIWSMTRAM